MLKSLNRFMNEQFCKGGPGSGRRPEGAKEYDWRGSGEGQQKIVDSYKSKLTPTGKKLFDTHMGHASDLETKSTYEKNKQKADEFLNQRNIHVDTAFNLHTTHSHKSVESGDVQKGGQGSGNFGHAGRPGERGGSSSEGGLKNEIPAGLESGDIARGEEGSFPKSYFSNKDAQGKAESGGLMEVENADLTSLGLKAKMKEWDESEHGVEASIYDATSKQLKEFGQEMPKEIRRISDEIPAGYESSEIAYGKEGGLRNEYDDAFKQAKEHGSTDAHAHIFAQAEVDSLKNKKVGKTISVFLNGKHLDLTEAEFIQKMDDMDAKMEKGS